MLVLFLKLILYLTCMQSNYSSVCSWLLHNLCRKYHHWMYLNSWHILLGSLNPFWINLVLEKVHVVSYICYKIYTWNSLNLRYYLHFQLFLYLVHATPFSVSYWSVACYIFFTFIESCRSSIALFSSTFMSGTSHSLF